MFFIANSISLAFFLGLIVYAGRTVSKRRNRSANASLLPFAYFSFIAWIVCASQHVTLIVRPFSSIPSDISLSTGLWLGVMQNVFWIISILSLYSRQFSRVSRALPLLVMISIIIGLVIALIGYQTTILRSGPFVVVYAVATATIFMVLGIKIWPLRVSKLSVAAFLLHGFTQWIWRDLWFTPSDKTQFLVLTYPLWHIALLFAWIIIISEMLVTSKVMISSTVKDLSKEREAAEDAINSLNLQGLRTETTGSRPYTPKRLCALWAEQCNIFVLIIGQRYGHIIKSEGISVVEFEHKIAYAQNPEKILVYVKEGVKRERRLKEFLNRLEDFEHGIFRSSFTTSGELHDKIQRDIADWLASQQTKEE